MIIKFKPHCKREIPYRVRWFNNPNVNVFIGDSHCSKKTTIKKEAEWFKRYQNDKSKKLFTIFAASRPIGLVGLTKIDKINKRADAFIIIGEDDYRGQGIGQKAMRFIIRYGFDKLKLHRIGLGVFSENKIAINCYKAVGFKTEGRQKEHSFFGGKYHDLVMMAILNKHF
ncbi:MAG: GNAT family protein [Patescibacteria group bacterium]|nr:GNAT family protein [Patescibacteria group bacterium]MDD5490841.1 GNAT family protein [Patescibacteria group bacterium]